MAGRVRYLLNQHGRYHARVAVPVALRPYLGGKRELKKALGGDRRIALRDLPGVVAMLQAQISEAEKQRVMASGEAANTLRFPMSNKEMAATVYNALISQDEEMRRVDYRYARHYYPDEDHAARMKDAAHGRCSDEELQSLVGRSIEVFRNRGNLDAKFGTQEWRDIAQDLAAAEYEALNREAERSDDHWTGTPTLVDPTVLNISNDAEEAPLSICGLFEDYIAYKKSLGKGREIEKRWKKPIDDLIRFVGHDNARKLTKQDIKSWRDHLLKSKSPKTIHATNLACIRAVLNKAVADDLLAVNVASDVKQEVPKKVKTRESGFNDAEAKAIIALARNHTAEDTGNPATTEASHTTQAKRWVPLLGAFTGARVSELIQLRKEDVLKEDSIHYIRITPDAGAVKTDEYRLVPLHDQLIEWGFLDFVKSNGKRLFIKDDAEDVQAACKVVANRIRIWMKNNGVAPDGVSPTHGWRHRIKTQFRDLEVSDAVSDGVTGHASVSQGDKYGDVSLNAKNAAIQKLGRF